MWRLEWWVLLSSCSYFLLPGILLSYFIHVNDHLSRLTTFEIRLPLSGTFELKDSIFIAIQLEGCFGSRCVRKIFKNHFFRKETKPIIAIEGGQFFVNKFTPFVIDDSFRFGWIHCKFDPFLHFLTCIRQWIMEIDDRFWTRTCAQCSILLLASIHFCYSPEIVTKSKPTKNKTRTMLKGVLNLANLSLLLITWLWFQFDCLQSHHVTLALRNEIKILLFKLTLLSLIHLKKELDIELYDKLLNE